MARKVKIFSVDRSDAGWKKKFRQKIRRFLKSKKKKRGVDGSFRVRKPRFTFQADNGDLIAIITYQWKL